MTTGEAEKMMAFWEMLDIEWDEEGTDSSSGTGTASTGRLGTRGKLDRYADEMLIQYQQRESLGVKVCRRGDVIGDFQRLTSSRHEKSINIQNGMPNYAILKRLSEGVVLTTCSTPRRRGANTRDVH